MEPAQPEPFEKSGPSPSDHGWPVAEPPHMVEEGLALDGAGPLLQALFERAPVGIMLIDWNGRAVAFNRCFGELLGYTRAELQQVGPSGFTHPDDRAVDQLLFEELVAGRRDHYRLEKRYIRKDGSVLWGNLTFYKIVPEGRPMLVAVIEDISERKAAEEALHRAQADLERRIHERTAELEQANETLRKSEQRFKLASYAINDALYDWDIVSDSIWWSDGMRHAFGYGEDQISGSSIQWWEERLDPDERARVKASLAGAFRAQAGTWSEEYRFRRSDGTYAPVFERGSILYDQAGRPLRMIGAIMDFSERARMEELRLREQEARAEVNAAREVDRLKTNFVNAISHELRTPLTSIFGYAEFLEDEVAGRLEPEQSEFVREIQFGARRLEALIDDLLDFARIDAGTFRLHRRAFELSGKVHELLGSLQPQAQKAQVWLGAELGAEHLLVFADPQRIGQVLFNLIGNALKFTDPGGAITVRAHCVDAQVLVEVEDTGIGMAPEDLSRLFQRFSQLEAGSRRGGTGLGLSISKAIIEAHGGTIGVRSAPGEGSTFWFTLPFD